MPLTVVDQGARNRIRIDPDVLAAQSGSITISGDDNEVSIASGCTLKTARIELGTRCRFSVGEDCTLSSLEAYALEGGCIEIGSRNYFTWHARLLIHEPGTISIGSDCGIASATWFTVSDMHPIFDRESGVRINPPRDVTVEDHVWIGEEAALLKGAYVGRGSVIGMRAVVTGAIPPHCIAAGIPARVVRRNIEWRV